MLATPDKSVCRLALIYILSDVGFHKDIQEHSIVNDTIIAVESMHYQLVCAVLSVTKQVVDLPKLSNLHSISYFKYDLILNSSLHPYDTYLRHCNTLSAFL